MNSKFINALIIIIILLVACQNANKNVAKDRNDNVIILNDTLLVDDTLVSIIKDYVDLYNIHKFINDNLVYQLLIEKSDSSGTVFFIDIIAFQDDFMKYFPFGRMKIGNSTIYISNTFNNPFKIDTNTQFVKKAMRGRNKLLSDTDQMQGVQEYGCWKIFVNKDTIIIDKHAISPYMPKKSNKEFVPPVIKDNEL